MYGEIPFHPLSFQRSRAIKNPTAGSRTFRNDCWKLCGLCSKLSKRPWDSGMVFAMHCIAMLCKALPCCRTCGTGRVSLCVCVAYINIHIEKTFPSKQHTESNTEEGEQTCACQHGHEMCELLSRRISTGPRPSAPRTCSARRYLAHWEPVGP